MGRNFIKKDIDKRIHCIVVGVSTGGMGALKELLIPIPADYTVPIVIVQHMNPQNKDQYLIDFLNQHCELSIKEADDKENIQSGTVYMAPADYHLLIEKDKTFTLTIDDKVNFSRPAIDVLFESAAEAYGPMLLGIILTGANQDGAEGLKQIKRRGGITLVQDPDEAECPYMPQAAIDAVKIDYVFKLKAITEFLLQCHS